MAAVCIELHDVAPATWPRCLCLLKLLDGLGAPPVTLLVVPDWHRRGSVERDPGFLHAMDERLARGDELALHGLRHLDEAPGPRSPSGWLRRRVLTADEGEFATLPYEEAFDRIAQGMALWNRRCWPLHGFVPPAWQIGAAARLALTRMPLAYTATRTHVERADGTAAVRTALACYSARAAWRRQASRPVVEMAVRAALQPLLRIALHPVDADHPGVLDHWRRLIGRVLARREPMTKGFWVRHVMEPALPGPPGAVTPA